MIKNLLRIKIPTKWKGNVRCITNTNLNSTPNSFHSGYEIILPSVVAK